MKALARTFLNEGEKERKEGGDKEIRKNVYGGRRKKKTWKSELEKIKGEWECWNVCGEKEKEGVGIEMCGGGKKTKTKTYGCNEKIEKRNNIKDKKS